MNNKDKKKAQKFMVMYMCYGMCFGVSSGLIFGMLLFPDNMSIGMCFGLPIGMSIGMALGSLKDKQLSEKMMEIVRIGATTSPPIWYIYAVDKSGVEKEYTVSEKKMKSEKFSIGDRVAEDRDGSLVSLESD